jgi:hypothetical protein
MSKGGLLRRQQVSLPSILLFLRVQQFLVNNIEQNHGDEMRKGDALVIHEADSDLHKLLNS